MQLGVQMLPNQRTNSAGDSRLFMKTRQVIGYNGLPRTRTPSGLYNSGFRIKQGMHYNIDDIPIEYRGIGIQFVANMIIDHIEASKKARQGEPLAPYGFKHPRTALVLPFFNATIPKGKWKYIFVIRDARDVATGDNQKLLRTSCHKIYPGFNCHALEFWARINTEIFVYLKNVLGSNFFLFRTEDFVSGNKESFEALAKFVGSTASPHTIEKIAQRSAQYNASYFGNEWKVSEIQSIEKRIVHNEEVEKAMLFFGYNHDTFGLSEKFPAMYKRLFP